MNNGGFLVNAITGMATNDVGMIPEFVLMQFTGLHDKNGKEIYEGDILHEKKEKTAPMANNGIDREIIVEDIRHLEFNEVHCEVIGNIYENPELLK